MKVPSPRRSLLQRAQDHRLKDEVENLYRPTSKIGDGSSWTRFSSKTRLNSCCLKIGHRIKLLERRSQLVKLLHDRGLIGTDREIIIEILKDIQHALSSM